MSIAVNQTVRNNLFVENNLKTPKLSLSSGAFTTSVTTAATADYDLVLPVDAGTANYLLKTDGAGNLSWSAAASGDALTANPLSQFAATTSAQLAGVISDETGTGALVFGTSPSLTTPSFASIVNGADTITIPAATTTLVGRDTSDILTNKTISGATNTISNINLTTQVTNVLRVTNGGTGVTTSTGTGSVVLSNTPTIVTPFFTTNFKMTNGVSTTTVTTAGTVNYNLVLPTTTSTIANGCLLGDTLGNLSWSASAAALTGNPLSQFAATTSAQLAGVISDETGSGSLVFGTSPTLSAPLISTIVNTGTLTLPTATTTLVGTGTADTLTNKTISGAANTISNISLTAAVTGILPVANGGTGATTLTLGNFLVGAGTSAVTTAKVAPGGVVVGTTDAQTLTNKTLTAPIISTISNTGTLTLPTSTDTIVGRATADTLTNKTLTAPVIATIVNGAGTLTLPTSTDTLVGKATADTLTNKTIGAATNSIDAGAISTGTLVVARGGTGATTLTLGNFLVGAGTSAVTTAKVAPTGAVVGDSDAQTLTFKTISGSSNTITNISLTSAVTGTLPVANGGTGSTTSTGTGSVVLATAPTISTPTFSTNLKIAGSFTTTISTAATANYNLVLPATASTIANGILLGDTLGNLSWSLSAAALTGSPLSQFASTTSAQLAGVISDETGTGLLVFGTSPTLTTPSFSSIVNGGTLTLPTTTDRLVGRDTTDTLTNKTLTAPVIASIVNGGNTLTLPNTTTTLVGTGTSDTLTNKTLTAPIIATISNGAGILTLPAGPDTLVGRASADTLTNKNLSDSTTFVVNAGDPTKRINFVLSGATPVTTLSLLSSHTAARSITFPDATTTLVGTGTADTLTNKTITAGTNAIDTGAITTGILGVLRGGTGVALSTGSGSNVLSISPALTAPVIATISNTGTLTLPTTTTTLVGTNTVDILTNKTLTAPVIATIVNTGTLTLPTSTDTLVGRATTDTLTNKTLTGATISGATNTITNISLTTAVTNTLPVANGGTGVTTSTGTGSVVLSAGSTFTGITSLASLRLRSGSVSTTVTSAAGVDYNLILPTAASTVANGCLLGDTLGNLSWSASAAALTGNPLSQFAATTSAQLRGIISDETGTGLLVFGTSPTLITPSFSSIVNTGTLTLPTSTDTLVGRATTDTLTNKTLTAPIIASIVNTGTLTLPTSTDTLVGRATTDTLTNKTIGAATNSIDAGAITTGTLAVARGGTGRSTLTANTFLIGNGTGAVDITKVAPTGAVVGTNDVQTITNKLLDDSTTSITNSTTATKLLKFDLNGSAASTTLTLASVNTLAARTLTFPDPTANDTMISRTSTDTLTNKTLSDLTTSLVSSSDSTKLLKFNMAPATTGFRTTLVFQQSANQSITMPDATDTLVGRATVDTLTNKTISGAANSISIAAASITSGTLAVVRGGTGTTTSTGTGDTVLNTSPTLITPVIASIVNTGTLTLPTSTDTLVGRATTDTLTNKTFSGPVTFSGGSLVNVTGSLATPLLFLVGSGGGGAGVNILAAASGTTTFVFPSTSGSSGNFLTTNGLGITSWSAVTLDASAITSGTLAVVRGGTGTTTSTGSGNNVLATSPTLTTPVIASIVNTGTLTLPTSTDTLVGRATADTLTNKDMTSNTNNVAARGLWSNNGAFLVGTYAAAAPVAGQVLAARINPSTFVVDASWQDPAVQYLMRVETSASQSVPGTAGGGTFVVDSSQMNVGMLITVLDQAPYYVVYSAEFSHSSATALCRFTIYVDGVAQTDFARVVSTGTANGVRSIVLSGIVSANAGSVISIRYSTNSSNLTILPRRTIIALKAVI